MASSVDNSAWLQWMTTLMGGVSRRTCAATLPPDRFYCLLDELPLHLIPRRALRSLRRCNRDEPLFLNPECLLCSAGQVPEELESRKELLSGFALQGTVAWVRSPATGNLLPFWLGPQLGASVQGLRPNEPAPSSLADSTRWLLAVADILISEDRMLSDRVLPEESVLSSQFPVLSKPRFATENRELRTENWLSPRDRQREEMIHTAGPLFQEKGYAPLLDLIHPFHIAALRRYYRYLIRTGAIRLGDGQSPRRYVAYNEPVARFFHHDIAATLSAVAGESVKPSYVYLASYLSGAELKKHTDREQCEFSLTLCLDFSPEPALATSWPICLDTPTSTVTVYQGLGDGLAYRGTRLPHYRSRLGEGQTSTSIFFHYVAEDFAGSLD
jgi:hypothetical protein